MYPDWWDNTKSPKLFSNDYFNKIIFNDRNLKNAKKYELLYLFWWIDAKISGLSAKFLDHSYRLFPDLGFYIQKNYYFDFINPFINKL